MSLPGQQLTLQGRVERVRQRDQREQRAEERQAVAPGVAAGVLGHDHEQCREEDEGRLL